MDTAPTPGPGLITVRVKHGSLKCGDLDVECKFQDTVKHLKQIICDKSPTHPEIRDQRLIYAGHLLTDDQSLKDVFGPNGEASQNCFTVHLAYSRMLSARFQQSSTPPPQAPKTPMRESSSPLPTNQTNDGPGQRNFSMPYSIPNLSNVQLGMNPDLIAMHEFYLRQMMAYMMQWSQISYQVLHSSGLMDPNSPQHASMFNQPPTVPEPPQPAQNVAPNAAADHGRVNDLQFANRVAEDDEAPRDMLDWLYTLVRVAFIFSVVYFYSNFTRFFLVVLCTALVVVFQRRQVARQAAQQAVNQRQENGANPPPQPPEHRPPGDNTGVSENTPSTSTDADNGVGKKEGPEGANADMGTSQGQGAASAENSTPISETEHPAQTVAANVARLSLRDITWTFFTTFFSSLIPEMPQNN